MKHIMLVGNSAWSMYNFRAGLIRGLLKAGYRISVVVPPDEDFHKCIEDLGAEFVDMELEPKGTNPISDLKLMCRLRKIFKSVKPDFIFFYTIKPNIYGSFVAHALGIDHIAVTTGLGYTFINNNIVTKIARVLYKRALKNAKEVWFLNNDDFESFLQYRIIPRSKGFVLKGEGVNLERFTISDNQTEKISFLLMARMLWDKGIGEYVESARVLKKKYHNVEFKLLGFVGVDNPSAITKEQIEAWQKEGVVEYLGATSDVVPFVRETSCIVLPSYREGIPITLLEAAATCKPIVTTDVAGCRDTVDDHVTGFLCQMKDIKSLVDAMEKIIKMPPEERQKMGEMGRKKIEAEFDEKIIIDIYIKTLQRFGL